ncbi:MAG: ORF6N domain-containing protein [Prolixibacteraceae bacterium]
MQLQLIQQKIVEIRGRKVMIDFDLASLYEVETRVLKQAVKRNRERFPEDFMIELTRDEYQFLRSQTVILETGRGKFSKYLSYAFTEQGVAMLSSVLKSPKAIQINIMIMRAFVLVRQSALTHVELTMKLQELEGRYHKQFKDVYDAINFLLQKESRKTAQSQRNRIGFKS